MLDEIAELVSVPTGVRGPHGRVVVADAEGVVVDRVLSEPPAQSHAVLGPAPALLPAVRAADETVTYLLVAVDRNGADLTWAAGGTVRTEGGPETETVDGGHDDVHKTREGGLDRRSQTRAEDSWGRNAEAVAAVLDKRVAERSPDLVLITGDVRAVAARARGRRAAGAGAARRRARGGARRGRQAGRRSRRTSPRRWRRSGPGAATRCSTGSGRRRAAAAGRSPRWTT